MFTEKIKLQLNQLSMILIKIDILLPIMKILLLIGMHYIYYYKNDYTYSYAINYFQTSI